MRNTMLIWQNHKCLLDKYNNKQAVLSTQWIPWICLQEKPIDICQNKHILEAKVFLEREIIHWVLKAFQTASGGMSLPGYRRQQVSNHQFMGPGTIAQRYAS